MSRKKGLFDFSTRRKRGKRSKSLFNFSTKKSHRKKGGAFNFSMKKGRGRKNKGLFSNMKFDFGGKSGLGFGLGGLVGSMLSPARMNPGDEIKPDFDSMRSYLKAHDMSPYNPRDVLYYMLHLEDRAEAQRLAESMTDSGNLQSQNRAVTVFRAWEQLKYDGTFNGIASDLYTGDRSSAGEQATQYNNLPPWQRGAILFFFQDAEGKRFKPNSAGMIDDKHSGSFEQIEQEPDDSPDAEPIVARPKRPSALARLIRQIRERFA